MQTLFSDHTLRRMFAAAIVSPRSNSRPGHRFMPLPPVKALFFDVFGTLVDWRSSVAREAEALLGRLSRHAIGRPLRTPGAENISPRWRRSARAARRSANSMSCIAATSIGSCRASGSRMFARHSRQFESGLAPARCLAGFRARLAAAQNKISHRAGVERQYFADGRSCAAKRVSVGCHPRCGDRGRLQAETARLSGGLRGVRFGPGGLHDGGCAFQRSVGGGGMRFEDRAYRAAG